MTARRIRAAARIANGPGLGYPTAIPRAQTAMAVEIERKFHVIDLMWMASVSHKRRIRQAYLTKNGRVAIRIRIDGEDRATLKIKTAQPAVLRHEYEYDIPIEDAEELLGLRDGAVIEKTRHEVPIGEVVWEIDVFAGENAGLGTFKRPKLPYDRLMEAEGVPCYRGIGVTRVHDLGDGTFRFAAKFTHVRLL